MVSSVSILHPYINLGIVDEEEVVVIVVVCGFLGGGGEGVRPLVSGYLLSYLIAKRTNLFLSISHYLAGSPRVNLIVIL